MASAAAPEEIASRRGDARLTRDECPIGNPEQLAARRYTEAGVLSRIRTFRRSMFTAAMPTDRTRWKQITGCVGEPFNVCMKYGADIIGDSKDIMYYLSEKHPENGNC